MPEVVSTVSTILGLLSIFKSERRASSDNEFDEFLTWLVHKQHKHVVEEINTNHQLNLSIKMLLMQNHEKVIKTLSSVDNSLALLTSKIGGLSEITHALKPNIELSDQAVSIIKQLNLSGEGKFTELTRMSDGVYFFIDGNKGQIEIEEKRFVEDDLMQLVELSFLIDKINDAGKRTFTISRAAVNYLKQTE